MASFILIASDIRDSSEETIFANDVAKARLAQKVWPFGVFTRNRRIITEGDRIVIYLSGKGPKAQTFIAEATASSRVTRADLEEPEEWGQVHWQLGLPLKRIALFSEPVPIKPLLHELSFMKSYGKWGAYLQGGCVSMSDSDYLVIRNRTSK